MGSSKDLSFAELYPELKGNDLEEAERNFEAYLAVVLRIYERIQKDPEAYKRFRQLTEARKRGRM